MCAHCFTDQAPLSQANREQPNPVAVAPADGFGRKPALLLQRGLRRAGGALGVAAFVAVLVVGYLLTR